MRNRRSAGREYLRKRRRRLQVDSPPAPSRATAARAGSSTVDVGQRRISVCAWISAPWCFLQAGGHDGAG